jgi:uncharacterized membrane protein
MAYGMPVFIAAVALPLTLGRIPPNPYYGFRTPKTQSSPSVWYPANRFAGWLLIAASGLTISFNLALWWFHRDWPLGTLILWMAGALVVSVLHSVAGSLVYLRRL